VLVKLAEWTRQVDKRSKPACNTPLRFVLSSTIVRLGDAAANRPKTLVKPNCWWTLGVFIRIRLRDFLFSGCPLLEAILKLVHEQQCAPIRFVSNLLQVHLSELLIAFLSKSGIRSELSMSNQAKFPRF